MRYFECFKPSTGDWLFPSFKLFLVFILLLWQNTKVIASFFLNQACAVIVLTPNQPELRRSFRFGFRSSSLGHKKAVLWCVPRHRIMPRAVLKGGYFGYRYASSQLLTGRAVPTSQKCSLRAAAPSQKWLHLKVWVFFLLLKGKITSLFTRRLIFIKRWGHGMT